MTETIKSYTAIRCEVVTALEIRNESEMILAFKPDGSIEYGPCFTADAAHAAAAAVIAAAVGQLIAGFDRNTVMGEDLYQRFVHRAPSSRTGP